MPAQRAFPFFWNLHDFKGNALLGYKAWIRHKILHQTICTGVINLDMHTLIALSVFSYNSTCHNSFNHISMAVLHLGDSITAGDMDWKFLLSNIFKEEEPDHKEAEEDLVGDSIKHQRYTQ